jgi:putative mycofactocin binding protein MftB
MASAACTEAASAVRYVVPGTVRVRPEDFGLLFYDTRTTNLTFVRSGERLGVGTGAPGEERELLLAGRDGRHEATVRLLRTLQEKGLIRAVGGAD